MLVHFGHPLLVYKRPRDPSQGWQDDGYVPLVWHQVHNGLALHLIRSRVQQFNCSHCQRFLEGKISWNGLKVAPK